MFLLDTNVLSELRRPDKADANVRAWASSVPVTNIFLSVITLLEIELGALSVERRDAAQGNMLRAWIDRQVVPRFESRTLPIDAVVARRGAQLHVPDPRAERDALIAATALVHGLTVVTRNRADFDFTGVRTLNPWGRAFSSREPASASLENALDARHVVSCGQASVRGAEILTSAPAPGRRCKTPAHAAWQRRYRPTSRPPRPPPGSAPPTGSRSSIAAAMSARPRRPGAPARPSRRPGPGSRCADGRPSMAMKRFARTEA